MPFVEVDVIVRLATLSLLLCIAVASAHSPPPLLPETQVAALADELSGETAKRNLEGLARFHRQRGSQGFHAAAELIAERARAYGLSDVDILQFPTDNKTLYGTQKAREAWDADEGELWEVKERKAGTVSKDEQEAKESREGTESKLASYAAEPIVLAEDSESGETTTELIDVGAGTRDSDYQVNAPGGRDVSGKIVLVSTPPSAVQDLAIGKYHAAGIVSYAQNQPTAWSGDNDNLIRWGHLDGFSPNKTFAFMVSPRTARDLQSRLHNGAMIRLHARVKAGQHPGFYEVVTATIPGADPKLKDSEIAFSCHLDHQRPGANDNASGCVTILEVARTLQKLIAAGVLPRPARTLRFIWPPEVEGTITLLNAKPEFARRIKAVIHMDMVGGDPDTKVVFHVTRGPLSLPSFVHDVAWAFAGWVNEESYDFAATGQAKYPLTAPEGGKEPLRAEYSPYQMGSDHDVYQDASFGIPAIYLNDWPDRYIHTNFDTAANIDPTKLKRAGFIGAASGYFLANDSSADIPAVTRVVTAGSLLRKLLIMQRHPQGVPPQVAAVWEHYERRVMDTLKWPEPQIRPGPRGPLAVFGYDYLADHSKSTPQLLSYTGAWGEGEEYAYEARNLADGRRSIQQITQDLSAEYGPVPTDMVAEYLEAVRSVSSR